MNNGNLYRFIGFELDVKERRLSRDGVPVQLTPKNFEVLAYLVERAGHLVEKDELLRAVWPEAFVAETNVSRAIHTLRKVLLDDGNGNKVIQTVATRGYRFAAPVERVSRPVAPTENLNGSGSKAGFLQSRTFRNSIAATFLVVVFLLIGWVIFSGSSRAKDEKGTANEEAYGLYLQGVQLASKRNRKDAEKAVEYLERAVQIDPDYALAYAALANAYGVIGQSGGRKSENYVKQRSAIEKALSLDDSQGQVYSELGEILMNFEWDYPKAETAFKRGIALAPSASVTHRSYAVYLNSMGRFDEAIAEMKTAIDLEPAQVSNYRTYGMILYYARKADQAIVQLERTLEIDPELRGARPQLCAALRMNGENDKAFECFLKMPARKNESPEKIEDWKATYAKDGWRGVFLKQIDEIKSDPESTESWALGELYASVGDTENAIATITGELDTDKRGWGYTTLRINPHFDSIRSDPRFQELLKRVNLE